MNVTRERIATSIAYPYEAPPVPGATIAVAPGVLWLRMPLPFSLDHINLWLIADGAGWTLVDCGIADDATRSLWTRLFDATLDGRPAARLIVTHCHPDHIGLAQWLCSRFGLRPWMTESEFLHAHAVFHRVAGTDFPLLLAWCRENGLADDRLARLAAGEDPYRKGVPGLPHAFRRINDGEEFAIGGETWRVIVGNGHSPEHAALYCDSLGVLIAGDMLLPRITTNVSVWPAQPDADPLGDFLRSLSAFEALPDDTLVLPSHGLPFRGARQRAAELRAHHRARLDTLAALCAAPRTAADLVPRLFPRKLDGHHLVFALGETIAHLNHLMQRRVLDRVASGASWRYVAAA